MEAVGARMPDVQAGEVRVRQEGDRLVEAAEEQASIPHSRITWR
jgi:hypothetical protein